MHLPLNRPALLLIGHGSRDAQGVAEFLQLAEQLRAALPERLLVTAFLELTSPSIEEGLEELVRRGARAIIAMPGMLMAAGHVKNDIPCMLNAFQAAHPEVRITFGVELGIHAYMLQAARERIESSEVAFGPGYRREETLLLVVGRGTSDPDVNSNICQITRLLWEEMGFGWAETCYSGVAVPLVPEALEQTARLGFGRIIVFPYVLFTGRLIRHIYASVDTFQARHPDLQAVKAPYLNDHPLVVRTFIERLYQTESGQGLMNCPLCQYRERIIGFEHRYRAPQTLHHSHDHPEHPEHGL